MFKSPTVFVVGAGASAEAGLPLGGELTSKIASLLNLSVEYGHQLSKGDAVIYHGLRELVDRRDWGQNSFIGSARSVAEAMDLAQSIDTFLESHGKNREFVQLGKMGIVRAIQAAERDSKLKPLDGGHKPFVLTNLAATWYYSLARQLFSGVPADEPVRAFDNVSFVIFNYDRCLQTFLVRAAEVYFRLTRPQAEQLIAGVKMLHPYGSLGSIFEGARGRVPYAPAELDILAAAERIRTFSESSICANEIGALVEWAETVVFLGFGFHDQNVELFNIAEGRMEEFQPKRVFATTKGMSPSDEEIVKSQLSYALTAQPYERAENDWISTNNGTCAELFATYWRSLTA
ncbi:hypothetical protein [Tsuneonella rigui]|uniref:hypothetical protein n=1 Tax=Tsuneonella rigui TaxID=1708790 RepID=UPI000F7F8D1C|nr:hypothetical protein [Tsuneonella rigui]